MGSPGRAEPSSDPAPLPSAPFTNIMGQSRVNQLGGLFINGRPLPKIMRMRIVEMANSGIKPCQISRQLRVSHGCVSKILNRYAETGSVNPGQIGGNPQTARLLLQTYEKDILLTKAAHPDFSAADIRAFLVREGVCSRSNSPSVTSINRLLKSKRTKKSSPIKHSIESILGEPTAHYDSPESLSYSISSGSSPSSITSTSSDTLRRNRTSFSRRQLAALEALFSTNSYPNNFQREKIAAETGLNHSKIQVWFSNRRARCRKHLNVTTSEPPSFMSPFKQEMLFPIYSNIFSLPLLPTLNSMPQSYESFQNLQTDDQN